MQGKQIYLLNKGQNGSNYLTETREEEIKRIHYFIRIVYISDPNFIDFINNHPCDKDKVIQRYTNKTKRLDNDNICWETEISFQSYIIYPKNNQKNEQLQKFVPEKIYAHNDKLYLCGFQMNKNMMEYFTVYRSNTYNNDIKLSRQGLANFRSSGLLNLLRINVSNFFFT